MRLSRDPYCGNKADRQTLMPSYLRALEISHFGSGDARMSVRLTLGHSTMKTLILCRSGRTCAMPCIIQNINVIRSLCPLHMMYHAHRSELHTSHHMLRTSCPWQFQLHANVVGFGINIRCIDVSMVNTFRK